LFPVLQTPRLLLSALQETDGPDVLELFSNPRVVEYYDLKPMATLADAEALIKRLQDRYDSGQGIRWAMRLKTASNLIGTCGFNSWMPSMRSAVLGYDLNEKYWRQGFMFEALSAIISYAFAGHLKCGELNRIQADTVPGNLRSEAVLRRLGFKEEGLRRESGFWKNAFHDLKCFGILRREFTRQSAAAGDTGANSGAGGP
jgi:ribosomal-protein-alanine N-acetyltransferase